MQRHEESKQHAAASVIKGAAVVSSRMKPSMLKIKKKCAVRRLPNKPDANVEVRDDGRCSRTDVDSGDKSCQQSASNNNNNITTKKDEKEKKKSAAAGSGGYVGAHTRKRLYDEQVSQRDPITNAIVKLDNNLMNLFGQDDDDLRTELERAEKAEWNTCHEKCRKFLYHQKRDHLLNRDEGFRKWLGLQEEDVKAGKGMSEEKVHKLRLLLTPTSTEMKRRYDELNKSGNAGVDEDAFFEAEQEEFRVNLQEMKKKGKNHYDAYRRVAKILAELRPDGPSMPPPENEEKRRKGFSKFGLKQRGDYNDEDSDGLITYDASTLSGSTNLSIEGNRNEEEEKKGLKSFSLFGRGDEVPHVVYISTNITIWEKFCCASCELLDDVVVGLDPFIEE